MQEKSCYHTRTVQMLIINNNGEKQEYLRDHFEAFGAGKRKPLEEAL